MVNSCHLEDENDIMAVLRGTAIAFWVARHVGVFCSSLRAMEEHGRQRILPLNIEARPAKAGEERYKADELHLRKTSFYIYISFYPSVHQQEVSSSNTGLVLVKGFNPVTRQFFFFFSPAPSPVWGGGWGQTLGLCQAHGAGFDCHGFWFNKVEPN